MREHRYVLRNTHGFEAPKRRIDAFKNSFFPHCINEWNNLSLGFREVRSLSLFKTKLIRLVRPEKGQLYGIHDHSGVCRLTQLRLGLNPLREHRFRHNFLDTTDPVCLSNLSLDLKKIQEVMADAWDIIQMNRFDSLWRFVKKTYNIASIREHNNKIINVDYTRCKNI